MSATYEPIATTTLTSDTNLVSFTSINTTDYTDLVLVIKASMNATGAGQLLFRFNGDTAGNYSYTRLYGDGSGTGSDRDTNFAAGAMGIMGNQSISSAGTFIANIQNYKNNTTYKTVISRGSDSAGGYVSAYASTWRSTAIISSIDIRCGSTTVFRDFYSGSTFTLYGIKAE